MFIQFGWHKCLPGTDCIARAHKCALISSGYATFIGFSAKIYSYSLEGAIYAAFGYSAEGQQIRKKFFRRLDQWICDLGYGSIIDFNDAGETTKSGVLMVLEEVEKEFDCWLTD